jgi:hypothetical protein
MGLINSLEQSPPGEDGSHSAAKKFLEVTCFQTSVDCHSEGVIKVFKCK